jgi:hypothetical protein
MTSKFPWRLDEEDPHIIYDADGEIIAKNYTFVHVDDFERICEMVNFAMDARSPLDRTNWT